MKTETMTISVDLVDPLAKSARSLFLDAEFKGRVVTREEIAAAARRLQNAMDRPCSLVPRDSGTARGGRTYVDLHAEILVRNGELLTVLLAERVELESVCEALERVLSPYAGMSLSEWHDECAARMHDRVFSATGQPVHCSSTGPNGLKVAIEHDGSFYACTVPLIFARQMSRDQLTLWVQQ